MSSGEKGAPGVPAEKPGRGRLWRIASRAFRIAEHLLAVLGLLFLVYHTCFDLSVVVSGSMSPTLRGESADDGDWVLTSRLSFCLRAPRRWEVVTFHNGEGIRVMKRVVGLPGETVALEDNMFFVNGEPVERPASIAHIGYIACAKLRDGASVDCGEGYFVLGDDSRDSYDSRFTGPVDPGRFIGRASLVIWPPSRVGFVNP